MKAIVSKDASMEPRWLVFRYRPVTLFSLKMSRATSTVGKTLLTPKPYAVKMAFVDAALRHVVYYSVTTGKILRLELGADGKSKNIRHLKLSRAVDRPDGMRAIGAHRLLLAENSGKMDIVTFEGPEKESAVIQTVKEGLESTPGVTATRGMAWIVEGKLNYRNDPNLKDKDPGSFKMYAVPLPKQ
jgi:hypothetical protein